MRTEYVQRILKIKRIIKANNLKRNNYNIYDIDVDNNESYYEKEKQENMNSNNK